MASSPPGARAGLLAAFSYPAFRHLWLGAFLSSIGTWIQDVALSWLIHSRLGDPSYLGLRSFDEEYFRAHSTKGNWNGSCELVAVQIEVLQAGQLSKFGRDGPAQLVVVQIKAC